MFALIKFNKYKIIVNIKINVVIIDINTTKRNIKTIFRGKSKNIRFLNSICQFTFPKFPYP